MQPGSVLGILAFLLGENKLARDLPIPQDTFADDITAAFVGNRTEMPTNPPKVLW